MTDILIQINNAGSLIQFTLYSIYLRHNLICDTNTFGLLPLEVVLHRNALTTFLNMTRQKGSIENDIALRQLIMAIEEFNYMKGSGIASIK